MRFLILCVFCFPQQEAVPSSAEGLASRPLVAVERPTGEAHIDSSGIYGEPRFVHRTTLGGKALILDLSASPYVPNVPTNNFAPSIRELRDRPVEQAKFDENAKPGQFVTPPAASR